MLFDEIEKASDSLWQLLLGVLDKGTLTLGDNRRVDFSQAMIFMTSNLGAKEMSELITGSIGFAPAKSGTIGVGRSGSKDLSHGVGSGKAKVLARVHEPHRQGRGLPQPEAPELCDILDLELKQCSAAHRRRRGRALHVFDFPETRASFFSMRASSIATARVT